MPFDKQHFWKKKQSFLFVFLLFTFGLGLVLHQRPYFEISLQNHQPNLQKEEPLEKVRLNVDNIKPFLFGFEGLVANLAWIYSVAEIDLMLKTQKDYNLYYLISHFITDLDPYFEPLYIYTANQLTFSRQGTSDYPESLQDAHEILLKGWDFYINRTEDWNHYYRYWIIPQMIGFNYYFEFKEKEKALPYYEFIANHVPQAPSLYRTFAAEIYKQLDQKDANLKVLEDILVNEMLTDQLNLTDNKDLKDKIISKMITIQGGEEMKEKVNLYLQQLKQRSEQIINIWLDQYPHLTLLQFLAIHPKEYREQLSSEVDLFEILFYQGELL